MRNGIGKKKAYGYRAQAEVATGTPALRDKNDDFVQFRKRF